MCADPRPQAAAAPWVRRRAAVPMASRTRGSKQPRTDGVGHVWHRRAPRAGVQGVRGARLAGTHDAAASVRPPRRVNIVDSLSWTRLMSDTDAEDAGADVVM